MMRSLLGRGLGSPRDCGARSFAVAFGRRSTAQRTRDGSAPGLIEIAIEVLSPSRVHGVWGLTS